MVDGPANVFTCRLRKREKGMELPGQEEEEKKEEEEEEKEKEEKKKEKGMMVRDD